jgi:uncharacterized membrane protein
LETIVQAVWPHARTTAPSATCWKHQELRKQFHAATRAYIEGAKSLDAKLQGDDFERAYHAAHQARLAFNRTRDRLHAHVARHGCTD